MNKNNIIFFFATFLLLLFLPHAKIIASGTASFTVSPESGTYKAGEKFDAVISVNPGGELIDTIRLKIDYSSENLEIEKFSLNPIFAYQAGANVFDNTKGTLSWGAGIPGGISSPEKFGTITFKVKAAGSSSVTISNSSLILSAGKNKFDGKSAIANFTFQAPEPAPEPAKNQPVIKTQTPKTTQPQKVIPAKNVEAAQTQEEISQNPAPEVQYKKAPAASLLNISLPPSIAYWLWVTLAVLILILLFSKIFFNKREI